MAGHVGRCAQNCKKIKLKIQQKYKGHLRWRIKVTRKSQKARKVGHHRWQGYIYKSRRNRRNSGKEPSQMAIYRGRYAQNFKKIEFKIIQTIMDGDMRNRLKARNSCVPPVASGKAERYKNLIQNYSKVLQDIGGFLKKAA